MKTLKIGVILLALLLAAMAIVPMVSVGNSSVSEEEKNLMISDNHNEPYYKDILITQMGKLPDKMQVANTLNKSGMYYSSSLLQKVTDDCDSGLEKFLYPNGPVIGYGYDMYGTMDVQIKNGSTVSQSELQNIYSVVEKAGEKNGIQDIPCKFLSLGLLKTEARTDRIRPVIGGI